MCVSVADLDREWEDMWGDLLEMPHRPDTQPPEPLPADAAAIAPLDIDMDIAAFASSSAEPTLGQAMAALRATQSLASVEEEVNSGSPRFNAVTTGTPSASAKNKARTPGTVNVRPVSQSMDSASSSFVRLSQPADTHGRLSLSPVTTSPPPPR